MPIFPPLFAKGKSNAKTVSAFTIGAASTTIVLSATASPIAAGAHVFVSNSDDTLCEYLGKAVSVVSATIVTMYPAQRARAAGAKLWTPTVSWQATSVISLGACANSRVTGIETLDTTADQPLHTRTGERRDYVEMTWSQADRVDWRALDTWLTANAGDGLASFTAAFSDPDVGTIATSKVKLSEPGREMAAQATAYRLRTWPLRLCVVTGDAYV